jgi:branched-chain amino acid transport system substrate-binding protein
MIFVAIALVTLLAFVPACDGGATTPPTTTPATTPATTPPTTAPPAPESIKVGVLVSLTGFDAAIGEPAKIGYELGAEKINQDGGVYVKEFDKKIPLELIYLDIEGDAETSVARAEALNSQYNVSVATGTTMISAAAEIFEKNKLPAISVASTISALGLAGYQYWFSLDALNWDIAPLIVKVFDSLPADTRPTKWALFEEQMFFVTELTEAIRQAAADKGISIVYEGQYATGAPDLSPLINGAKGAGAEVLFSSANTGDAITTLRQSKELGFNPKAIIIIRGCDDPAWADLGPMGEYVIGNNFWAPTLPFAGNEELVAAHMAEYGTAPHPLVGSPYAAIQVIADAIERAGTLDRDAIKDALHATDMMTVKGQIKFNETGGVIDPIYLLQQWQNGVQEIVWPDDMATKALVYPIP